MGSGEGRRRLQICIKCQDTHVTKRREEPAAGRNRVNVMITQLPALTRTITKNITFRVCMHVFIRDCSRFHLKKAACQRDELFLGSRAHQVRSANDVVVDPLSPAKESGLFRNMNCKRFCDVSSLLAVPPRCADKVHRKPTRTRSSTTNMASSLFSRLVKGKKSSPLHIVCDAKTHRPQ